MKGQRALVLGVVAAGAFSFFLLRRQERAVTELRQQVDLLVEETRDQTDSRGPAKVRSVGYPISTSAAPVQREAASPHDGAANAASPSTEQQMKEVHQRYEAKFARADVDAEWAARASQIVDQKLPSLLPEGSILLPEIHRGGLLASEGQLWNAATYSTPLNDDPRDGLMVTCRIEGENLGGRLARPTRR